MDLIILIIQIKANVGRSHSGMSNFEEHPALQHIPVDRRQSPVAGYNTMYILCIYVQKSI